jgi:hypothetical protein
MLTKRICYCLCLLPLLVFSKLLCMCFIMLCFTTQLASAATTILCNVTTCQIRCVNAPMLNRCIARSSNPASNMLPLYSGCISVHYTCATATEASQQRSWHTIGRPETASTLFAAVQCTEHCLCTVGTVPYRRVQWCTLSYVWCVQLHHFLALLARVCVPH